MVFSSLAFPDGINVGRSGRILKAYTKVQTGSKKAAEAALMNCNRS